MVGHVNDVGDSPALEAGVLHAADGEEAKLGHEDDQQHDCRPEDGQGVTHEAQEGHAVGCWTFGAAGGEHAEDDADGHGEGQGGAGQQDCGKELFLNQVHDRAFPVVGVAQVELQDVPDIAEQLHQQRLVQAEAGPNCG